MRVSDSLTLSELPAADEIDHLEWALETICDANGDICVSKRVHDFILRLLVTLADYEAMDQLHEIAIEFSPEGVPEDCLRYVLSRMGPDGGPLCLEVLPVTLRHFVATANLPAIEAVYDECVREFIEAETEDAAANEYRGKCLSVACPRCDAEPLKDCTAASTAGKKTQIHAARAVAYQDGARS